MKIYDIHFLEKYQQILDAIIEVNGIISTQYDEKNAMNWAEWCVVTNIEPIAAEYSLHDSEFLLSVVRENNRHENFLYF